MTRVSTLLHRIQRAKPSIAWTLARSLRAPAHAFTSGLNAALPIGAAVLGVGTLAALLVPGITAARTEGESESQSDLIEGVLAA